MQLNTVVLPAPLGPIRAVISPRCALNERSWIATSPPKRMLKRSTRSTGAAAAGTSPGGPSAAVVEGAETLIRGPCLEAWRLVSPASGRAPGQRGAAGAGTPTGRA